MNIIPSLLRPRASPFVRNVVLSAHTPPTAYLARSFAYSHRLSEPRKAEASQDEKAGFKDQLWQSSTDRVLRERAEQQRYAQHRSLNTSSAASRSLGMAMAVLFSGLLFYNLGSIRHPPASTQSTLPLENLSPPVHDTSSGNLQAAWVDLKNIVGEEFISTTDADLNSHSGSSWSSYEEGPSDRPFCVIKPISTEEVSEIMKVAHKRRIPVTAYSGGTSLEGHFAATRGGVCVDFSRMDKLLAVHDDDLDCIVQPALGWEILNGELAKQGLFFPPDPGPGAQIGGMVGTGCSGTNAYRYGTMRDWVISLTVVLADGTIVKTRQRPRKSSAGYDLTRLFIGSEGTLGLVTEATLKLTSLPQNVRVAIATFPSVKDAADCVTKVVRGGVPIAAVELLDDVQMKTINQAGMTSKTWTEAPTLFFKFNGTQSAVKESISLVQGLAKKTGSKSFEFAKNAEEGDELWEARKMALWAVVAAKEDEADRVWTTDVAVPVTQLPVIVEETKADMLKSGLLGSIVGHVGDGNFHAIILYSKKTRPVAEEVVHRMVKRAIELEGTGTGEHGVGLIKRDYLEHELSKDTVDAMRAIKRAWDPLCLLNCDKVVRAQKPRPGEVAEW